MPWSFPYNNVWIETQGSAPNLSTLLVREFSVGMVMDDAPPVITKDSLTLDDKLGNIDGKFVPGLKNFTTSARNLTLTQSTLTAELCGADRKTWRTVTIDLGPLVKAVGFGEMQWAI